MKSIYPLTETGKGIKIFPSPEDLPSIQAIEDLIDQYQFVVLKKFNQPLNDLHDWLGQFGELVSNKRRVDENVLILDGSKKEEVVGGVGRMPLHCDGLLMGETVRLVAIYCLDCNIKWGGRTYISDNEAAWHKIPEKIKALAKNNGIEVMPVDKDYFVKNDSKFYQFSGIQEKNGKTYFNGGMHYHKDEPTSWLVKFQNIDEELSYKYFNQLESIYESNELTYFHEWEAGDLIIMDNIRTMHGREAFEGKRILSQFQIKE